MASPAARPSEGEWRLYLRLFWAVLVGRATLETIRSGELRLDLLDLRPSRDRAEIDLRPVLRAALQLLSEVKGGFGELVTDHLTTVVAAAVPRERILHRRRAYVCRFDGDEARDARYLACLLIWSATSARLARDQEAHRDVPDHGAIRAASRDAQLRFLRQLPDSERLAEALGLSL